MRESAQAAVEATPGATRVPGWQVRSSASTGDGGAAISTPGYAADSWLRVSARSTVLAGLVENGVYPDLFVGTNLRDAVDATDFAVPWWYRADLTIAAHSGLTTLLDVAGVISRGNLWINGHELATSRELAGAWTTHTFDITRLVRPGANSIAVEVFPNDPDRDLTLGWIDWNPAPPDRNMGIFRDVTVRRTGPVTLASVQVLTSVAADLRTAGVTVRALVQNNREHAVTAEVSGAIGDVRFQETVRLSARERAPVTFTPAGAPQLTFREPRIWWPHDLGEQPLYDLDLRAAAGGVESDGARTTFGIRDVRSSLTGDGHRRYEINGMPLLIRGGGWAPDLFLRFDRTRLEDQVRYTKDLGLNTIRLEGKLENDEFFELADRHGVLVLAGWECCDKWERWEGWSEQDVEIAARSTASEAVLLRNHPSVIGFLIGSDETPPDPIARRLVHALEEAGWPTPIISSAADRTSGVAGPSGLKMTGPYEWVPPVYWYTKRRGGAFGFNSETSAGPDIPPLDTIETALAAEEREALWRDAGAAQFHRGPIDNPLFSHLRPFGEALARRYGPPTSLRDFVTKAQLTNYEVVRAQFEAYARNFNDPSQPSTGVIYWMLNNAWPSLHWHLFDSYLDQGGAYFGARTANRPLHVQWSYDDGSVVVVNRGPAGAGGLSVAAAVYGVDGGRRLTAEAGGLAVSGGGGTVRALGIPATSDLPTAYFIELMLADASGRTVDRNVYWYSAQPDVVDYVADPSQHPDSYWFYDPQSQFAALSPLMGIARVVLDVSATSVADDEGLVTTSVTLRHPSSQGPPAFFVGLRLRGAGGARVLPITWRDNLVTLFAGQSLTLDATHRADGLGGAAPTVEVAGVNVSTCRIAARQPTVYR